MCGLITGFCFRTLIGQQVVIICGVYWFCVLCVFISAFEFVESNTLLNPYRIDFNFVWWAGFV